MKTRLQKVLSGLESRNFDFTYAQEYGEPGYHTDKPLILLANWNSLSKSELRAVESVAEIEWSDEWITDGDGLKCYRTQPDSYGWQSSILWGDDYFLPISELSEGESLVSELEDLGYIDNSRKALPSNVPESLMETAFELVSDDNETGWYPGQNAKPEKVLASLPSSRRYVFRISGKGQFDMRWQVWAEKEDTCDE